MLLDRETSGLLLIDVQEKLTPLVFDQEKLLMRLAWLLRLAERLGVPVHVSEQYPKGLGVTCHELSQFKLTSTVSEKVHFSCWRCPETRLQLEGMNKQQFVLVGIETHVCVLQTALDLLSSGYDVFVVVDAVSSRFELDRHYGLKRMKQAGAELLTSEMVFFEWVEKAGTKEFKTLSEDFLK